MIGFLIFVVVIAISLLIVSKLQTGVEASSSWIALIVGATIGALNSILSCIQAGLELQMNFLA